MTIISQPASYFIGRQTFTLITLTLVLGTVNAEEFDVTGVIESVNNHNVQPITESHVILLASMNETVVPNDLNSPWKGAAGPCGGAVEIKEGKVKGNGLCTFTDLENDKFVISWTAQSMNEQGGPIGVWQLIGGSGKYVNATAEGNYSEVTSDNPVESTISIVGQLEIP